MLKRKHDIKADAVYIYLSDAPVAYTKELDDNRLMDYSADHKPVGIDLLSVSKGVDVEDLPRKKDILKVLDELKIKTLV